MPTFTPQSRAITALVLAFLLLSGNLNRVVFLVIAVFGDAFPDGRPGVALASVILLLIAAAITFLAFSAAAARPDGWSLHLSHAAVLLALLGVGLALLTLLGSVVQGEEFFAFGLLPG